LALNASKNSRVCVGFMELAQEVEIITSVSLQGNALHKKSFVSVPSKTN
jgi:hypothetical protein